jgi:hydrogenase-4 component B
LAGALLHVWNHGLFKALLFLSAGAVIHATHTRSLDRLGGIAKAMPQTALYFAVGAVAICGLPPLNGFVSELLIYLGLFRAISSGGEAGWAGAAFAAPALAMIGALAVACFVKVFGTVFLGTARSEEASLAREPERSMTGPMAALAGFCLLIGLAPALVAPVLEHGMSAWAPELAGTTAALAALAPLGYVSVTGLALCAAVLLSAAALSRALSHGGVASRGTWDCGYAAPTQTMQYTASSFAQMLVGLFDWVLRPRVHGPQVQPLFAGPSRFESHVPDVVLDDVLRPLFRLWARGSQSMRYFQAGSVQAYLFYIVVFLIGLLLWR